MSSEVVLFARSGDIARLTGLGVAGVGMSREPHAAQVGHNHHMIGHQPGRDRRPHVAGIAEAVQQDNRRPLTTDTNIELSAIGLDGLGLERGWKRLDGGGRNNKQQGAKGTQNKTQYQISPLKITPPPACANRSRRRPA